jgi:hypothetical protein
MAKEPAGLRRWRLAHRKHKKHRKVYVVARRRRSYRGRKGRGRRSGSKAIPVLEAVIVGYPIYNAYKATGLTGAFPEKAVFELTGYAANSGKLEQPQKAVALVLGLLVASKIGGPIASRVGLNRMLKKFSGGMIKFA